MKNRSTNIIVLFSLLLSLFLVSSVGAIGEQISVTLQSQSPDPVEPGQLVTLKFKVENIGKESTEDIIVKITPKFPFTIYGDVAEKNLGKLRASSTGADAEIVEFKLKIDEAAVEGEVGVDLNVYIGDAGIAYTNDELTVDIQTHDAILDITSITSEPKQISPGQNAKVTIMVKNLADSLLKDIKFKLDFSGATIPLAPYQSSSERRISNLKTNFQNSLDFQVIADPSATPGLYKIPLNITYNDEKGNAYSISDILALTIGETPDVKVYIKKSAVLQDNTAGKVTLELANAGSSNVKYMELYLLPSDDYKLVSTTDYFYLGDVDSDDTESEEIDIFINRGVDTLTMPVQIKYYDANNKEFQQTVDLEMELYSSSQLKKYGVLESSNTWIFFVIILLGVGGWIYYKKYYKKNRKLFSKSSATKSSVKK
jgi:hypothetical protein